MFQYAAARAVADRCGAELVLDHRSGFVRDTTYQRSYALSPLAVRARLATPMEMLPLWLFRALQRWQRYRTRQDSAAGRLMSGRQIGSASVQAIRHWFGDFFVEPEPGCGYAPIALNTHATHCWLLGYWQSPAYFHEIAHKIKCELMPPAPSDTRYRHLATRISGRDTIAIGVRMYEESPNPGAVSATGAPKSLREAAFALKAFLGRHPSCQTMVFCTHRAPALKTLGLPPDCVYITGDDGYTDALATLWLLTQCRHHLFLNSTYYWWGAWLSAANFGGWKEGQEVLAANNFRNPDSYELGWSQF